jgi:uncharacterized glyoxalase superfamily protein PhnB
MPSASHRPPKGYPSHSVSLATTNAAAHIDWLCKAFGFEVRLEVEADNGKIAYSELLLGDGLVSVADRDDRGQDWFKSPKLLGGCSQAVCVFVDDLDAHCERARAAGATIATEPKTSDYGDGYWVDRSYEAIDLEGHHWWFTQRLETK